MYLAAAVLFFFYFFHGVAASVCIRDKFTCGVCVFIQSVAVFFSFYFSGTEYSPELTFMMISCGLTPST